MGIVRNDMAGTADLLNLERNVTALRQPNCLDGKSGARVRRERYCGLPREADWTRTTSLVRLPYLRITDVWKAVAWNTTFPIQCHTLCSYFRTRVRVQTYIRLALTTTFADVLRCDDYHWSPKLSLDDCRP